MNIEQLDKGIWLQKIIQTTRESIIPLKTLVEKRDGSKSSETNDGQYRLAISEHKDGSGSQAALYRYKGNAELLDIIISTLERQLKELEEEFESL